MKKFIVIISLLFVWHKSALADASKLPQPEPPSLNQQQNDSFIQKWREFFQKEQRQQKLNTPNKNTEPSGPGCGADPEWLNS